MNALDRNVVKKVVDTCLGASGKGRRDTFHGGGRLNDIPNCLVVLGGLGVVDRQRSHEQGRTTSLFAGRVEPGGTPRTAIATSLQPLTQRNVSKGFTMSSASHTRLLRTAHLRGPRLLLRTDRHARGFGVSQISPIIRN